MRWISLVALVVLASCDGSGVQFIVHIPADYGDGDPAVQLPDEVRLFIGIGEEHQDRLAPEGFNDLQKRFGTYWLRDPSNVDPEVDRAPISIDQPAVFSYVRSGSLEEFGVVVAVGYTNGEPTSSAAVFHAGFGDGVILRYPMGLNGAADPRDQAMRSRVNQLEIWGANECVHIDNRRSDIEDVGHRVAFIVDSIEDRDCDGLIEDTPTECNADVYMGNGPSSIPSCLSSDALLNTCRIGAPRCQDGVGADTSCRPTRYCASTQICEVCANHADPWECAQAFPPDVGTTVTYGLDCRLPAHRLATTTSLCDKSFTVTITPPPGTTCEDVEVKATTDPELDRSFSLGGPPSTAYVKITNAGCKLTIETRGDLGTNVLNYGAILLVDLDGERGIAAPVSVEILPLATADACGQAGTCTWIDTSANTNPDPCVLGS